MTDMAETWRPDAVGCAAFEDEVAAGGSMT
jgi:hypothetical protein